MNKTVLPLFFNFTQCILKFASTEAKKAMLRDEIQNYLALQNCYGVAKLIKYDLSVPYFIMKQASGFAGCTNLRELLSNNDVPDLWFREIFFQIIYNLAYLQFCFPGFRHNDFKADNILLECPSTPMTWTWPPVCNNNNHNENSKLWHLENNSVGVTFIDFEVCTTTNNTCSSSAILRSDEQFGLSNVRCDVFDIHLLISELRSMSKLFFRSWSIPFLHFVQDFFDDSFFDNTYNTNQMRLSYTAQNLMSLRWNHDNFLVRLLSHEYFLHLRTN